MRQILLILTMTMMSFSTASPQSPVLDGLIHWWPSNGNADDVVAGLDGVLNGDTSFGDGVQELGFQFDGTGDFVEVPFDLSINFDPVGEFSLVTWVRPRRIGGTASGYQAIVVKGPVNSLWNWGIYLTPEGRFFAGFHDNYATISQTSVVLESWYCVCFTYRSGEWNLYVNGSLEDSNEGQYITQSTGGLHLGYKGDTQHYDYFQGRIDHVQIFNRQLNQTEVSCLFDCPLAGIQETVTPEVAVARAFPNPFRHGTRLVIDLAEVSAVSIFDVTGRPIRKFTVRELQMRELVWDGKSETGAAASPGMYLCKVAVKNRNYSCKLLKIR